MAFLKALWDIIKAVFIRPNYDKPVIEQPMNAPDINKEIENLMKPKRERILDNARSFLGKDASPENKTNKETACAESVAHILNSITPSIPKGVLSTIELAFHLDHSDEYKDTRIPKEGNIIVSPRKGSQLGHTGIFITTDTIASNDSRDGLFQLNYSFDEWAQEMRQKRGLRIFIYEAV